MARLRPSPRGTFWFIPTDELRTPVDLTEHIASFETLEDPMPSRARTAAQLRRELSRIAAELERLESLPAEPVGTAPTVLFQIRFVPDGEVYTYAARKANGYWYTTGPKGGTTPRTWDDLVQWIDSEHISGIGGAQVRVVTETVPL